MVLKDKLQRPLHDLRISVIDRCNFRCPYCMPEQQFSNTYQFMDKNQWLSFDEILRLVHNFASLGVTKVRLTGGEPLLRPDIDQLIHELSKIKGIEDLALTSNGSVLKDQAAKLKAAGLKRLTVSLDSLNPDVFRSMNGHKGHLEDVLAGIKAADQAGFQSIKINTVIQRGVNDHTILDLVRFAREGGHTIRFIEYMDVGNQNHWDLSQVVSSDEIIDRIKNIYPLKQIGDTAGGETSLRYQFNDGKGEIGFISSVSHPFCSTCNRLRLSADGTMYTCLFATQGTNLKSYLRDGISDDSLKSIIQNVWSAREDRYSQLRSQIHKEHRTLHKVEMFQIGG